jgi:hypothetical protein
MASRFRLKSDNSNCLDENIVEGLSKRKEVRQANSTEVDKTQQAEIERLRLALVQAIEENDLVC